MKKEVKQMQKINLIYPDSRRFTSNFSTHKFPALATAHAGLPILGAILKKKGYQVSIYDEKIIPPPPHVLYDCDLLGISIQTITSRQGYRIADEARKRGVPVVIGGVHATLNPDEAIGHADFLVRNEGEETLPELVQQMEGRRNYEQVLGLSFRDGKKKTHNPARPLLKNLDKVPLPDWRLIAGWENPLLTPINYLIYFTQVSRGCPFLCNFCSITKTFGHEYRSRSPEHVVEELKERPMKTQNVLFFLDDSIAADKDYLKTLLELMVRKKCVPEVGWHSQMRADVCGDKELLKLMKKTNCLAATFGFESINPETLRFMQKGQSVETIKRCIKAMHDHDIFVIGFFVFGSDHDTVDTIRQTVQFAKDEGVDFSGFMPLTPFPGTPFYEEMESQGRIFSYDWELYDVEHVVYYPARMTPYELYTETLRGYKDFYTPIFNPRRYMKIIRRAPTLFGFLMGFAWPYLKRYSYRKEQVANRDYLQALWNVSQKKKKAFPVLSGNHLWFQDILSGRTLRERLAPANLLLDPVKSFIR